MKHDYEVVGPSFSLRPVSLSDAIFIHELRSNEYLNRFINHGATTVEEQETWITEYYKRENDYYFVITDNMDKSNHGLISAYGCTKNTSEWGRWVIKQGSLSALESAWLIYRFCFEVLKLSSVYCRTLKKNEKVVLFHNAMLGYTGFTLKNYVTLDGLSHDAVEHVLEADDWGSIRGGVLKKLERLSQR